MRTLFELSFQLPSVCVVWSLSALTIIEQKVTFDCRSASGNRCVSETFMLVLKKGYSVLFLTVSIGSFASFYTCHTSV